MSNNRPQIMIEIPKLKRIAMWPKFSPKPVDNSRNPSCSTGKSMTTTTMKSAVAATASPVIRKESTETSRKITRNSVDEADVAILTNGIRMQQPSTSADQQNNQAKDLYRTSSNEIDDVLNRIKARTEVSLLASAADSSADDANDNGADADPIDSSNKSADLFDTSIAVILSPNTSDGAHNPANEDEEDSHDDHFVHSFEEEEQNVANLSAKSMPEDVNSPSIFGDAVQVVRLVHSHDDAEDLTTSRCENNPRSGLYRHSEGGKDGDLELPSPATASDTLTLDEGEGGLKTKQVYSDTSNLDKDEADLYLGSGSTPRLQESDDLSSVAAYDDDMSFASDDSFVHLMIYCRLISKSEEGPEWEKKYRDTENVLGSIEDGRSGDETVVSSTTLPGDETKQRFTNLDVLHVMSMSEENAERKKKDRFTSLDVVGILFGRCMTCGCSD